MLHEITNSIPQLLVSVEKVLEMVIGLFALEVQIVVGQNCVSYVLLGLESEVKVVR